MIRLTKVSFQYDGHSRQDAQLRDIQLHIQKGELILLTGKSGCGKTTLTRILNGLCPRFYPGTLTGEYLLAGRDASKMSVSELGRRAGSVFQDPRSQFFATNTTDEIVLGMEHNAIPRDEMQRRLRETAAEIGVTGLLDRPLFSLSSGEKQRIAIAAACAIRPEILILDEPSANLDSDTIERLSGLLFRLKEAGITIILSEHRLHYTKDFFDRMVVLENGSIQGIHTREQARALDETAMNRMGLRLFCEPDIPAGQKAAAGSTATSSAGVSAEQISLSFDGQKILDSVSFSMNRGSILAITGGNGAGKSTLCRVLTGLYKPGTGLISLNGVIMKRKQRIRHTFFVQQDTDYQLYGATVEEEFLVAKKRKTVTREFILNCLKMTGLEDVLRRHPLSLSGGQKQRLLLALALASGKDFLVLDEPTSGLDGSNMRLLAGLFKTLAAAGKTLILITHDRELINSAADSILHLDNGSCLYHRQIQRLPSSYTYR